MIVIKVEMWPGGDESRAKEFGRAVITNKMGRTMETGGGKGDYTVSLHGGVWGMEHYKPRGNPWKQGSIEDFDRVNRGAWDLIFLCLRRVVGWRNPK